jgi:UrcA family protein
MYTIGSDLKHQLGSRLMTIATSKPTICRRLLVPASTCAALLVTTLSVAAPASGDVLSVTVRYDDLNLASPAGMNTLYKRIARAARDVCPEDSLDLAIAAESHHCRADAITRAINEVNNQQLALARASHGPQG